MIANNHFNKEYFNGKGSNYKDYNEMDCDHYWMKRLNPLLNYVKRGRLLELGCAYGFFLKRAKRFFDVIGLDVSEYALEQTRFHTPECRLEACDLNNRLPFGESEFDVIAAFDTLEHVVNMDFCIGEISRVLKRGGFFVFQVPVRNVSTRLLGFLDMDKTHVSITSEEKLMSLFSRNCLHLLEGMSLYTIPVVPALIEIWSGKRIARYVLPYIYGICKKKS
jgi:SAM-dependent methyltransferase